jgi:hypothetical protein
MAQTIGDNLSNYANLDFLTGSSPEELKAQLAQIRLPHKIVSIYGAGTTHVAWVVTSQPIKKQKRSK